MNINIGDREKLILHNFGFLAQKRLARGLRLNHPESIALITSVLLEKIRDGKHTTAELRALGKTILGFRETMDGIAEMIPTIQVEGTFNDGTKLITIHEPICSEQGDLTLALYGSFLPLPDVSLFKEEANPHLVKSSSINSFNNKVNGFYSKDKGKEITTHIGRKRDPWIPLSPDGIITLNEGRTQYIISVTNMSDRPIQVGSHFHFMETNKSLQFDRLAAYGKRLNIASGTAVRFEPGETLDVKLIEIVGSKIITGGNNLGPGLLNKSPDNLAVIEKRLAERKFLHKKQDVIKESLSDVTMHREEYQNFYGALSGDKIQLGDTGLVIEIENELSTPGEELVFGGGKNVRDGMGMKTGAADRFCVDVIITNVIILDHSGIIKADVGIKDGWIAAIGNAGNPDTMHGLNPDLIVGVCTEVISGEGLILTAGGIDTHVHFICPQQIETALATGVTTFIGGGVGPATGTKATTATPGADMIEFMLQSTDNYPINIGLTGRGSSSSHEGLVEMIEAGAIGLKIHEDWGATPACIEKCLDICEKQDVQCTLHTDTLNEAGNIEDTMEAIKGRSVHMYHVEGAGGGHAPDIIRVCGYPNILPGSTNPTNPYTVNTIDEHLDMLMVCHHLDRKIHSDVMFADSRIRQETIMAEDILHDIGGISIMASDSQAMGRVGEVILRTWQLAAKNKAQRGVLPEDKGKGNDNFRVKRYISKYTINPAKAHGISHVVGSVTVGKFADLVLWNPKFFGVKPEMVIKGGHISYACIGDANASIPTPEPSFFKPMWSATHSNSSLCFVSYASVKTNRVQHFGLKKRIITVKHMRKVGKKDMVFNDWCKPLRVDPDTFKVFIPIENAEGKEEEVELVCEPAKTLPLARRYFMF